jgi:hypothetical protein
LRRLIRLDIKLTDGQALNVKIVKPPFHQAKPPYAEHANGKRTDCGSAQSQRSKGDRTHRKTTIDLNLCHRSLGCAPAVSIPTETTKRTKTPLQNGFPIIIELPLQT